MHRQFDIDPRHIAGKRPNLSAQNSVADKIVSAFSDPEHEPPLPPLSAVSTGKKSVWEKVFCIVSAVMLFGPFLVPAVLMILSAAQGYAMPALMYLLMVLAFRNYSVIGGLVVYLAARRADAFRKPIGWIALTNALLTIPFYIFVLQRGVDRAAAIPASLLSRILFTATSVASILCMIALCVFCILLLVRCFQKKEARAAA